MVAKAERVLADAKLRAELEAFAVPLPDANPERMLLAMVSEAAGNVAYLGARVRELSQKRATNRPLGLGSARDEDKAEPGAGLFGPVISVDKDGGEHITGEEYRAATKLYGEWADRLVKYSKTALDAGIAKAQVELAQSQGQTVVVILNRVLVQLGLGEDVAAQARRLMAEEFRAQSAIVEGEPVVLRTVR